MALPAHTTRLLSNIAEVRRLLEIHETLTGKGPGKRHNVQVLNKSAIILLVACWEAFVEDLCEAAFDFMLKEAPGHSAFPDSVLERVGSKHQGLKAWDLAGAGWKVALQNHRKEVLARTTDKLNTPAAEQVKQLFHKTIGLDDLDSAWHWHGKTIHGSATTLNGLVKLRGSIAHRVQASETVWKKTVLAHIKFVRYLAVKSTNHVRAYVHKQTGKDPWSGVSLGKVR